VLLRFEAASSLEDCFLGGQSASAQTLRTSPLSMPSETMASAMNLHV
jgi:hypothetical protein